MARKAASTVPEQGTLFEDRFLEDYAGQIMRDPVVAPVELVANAWDAYARKVDIASGLSARSPSEPPPNWPVRRKSGSTSLLRGPPSLFRAL